MIDLDSISVSRYIFPKKDKLCSEKCIDELFRSGNSFISYPLRIVFSLDNISNENDSEVSVLTSVSKRKFKRAVKRNRVKRLIREAYRLNKTYFIQVAKDKNQHINIAFIYLHTDIVPYSSFEKAIQKASKILAEKMIDL